ncbi:acyltransferase domain-containing protein [Amycolatopsis sp. cmx-8-4]|uniref:acyltransferase domain-containing protein n=1 Tax=Amycolatopsis sp. cmx-8-4 TaxID=2790947 RepID=UPI003979D3F4
MRSRTVFLFPGLGAYSTGVLREAHRSHSVIGETFAEIDAAAAASGVPPVSDVLFGTREYTVKELLGRQAELLQLAIFGTSVATHRLLVESGAEPDLLLGHSFGEMAALVSAGAFTLADGVRLVCARSEALRPWEGKGAMAAVGANETVVAHLIGLVEEPDLVLGCANAPRQNVVAGPADALSRLESAAEALGFFFARLNLPYASHHPSMSPAVAAFMDLMAPIRQRPLRAPVYSPVHRRRYTDADDLKRAIADCLVLPVRFVDAVRDLHAQGCTTYVEVGALNALTRCVQATVPAVRTFAPLLIPADETANLRVAAEAARRIDRTTSPAAPASVTAAPEAALVAPLAEPPRPPAAPAEIPQARTGHESVATSPADRDQVLERLCRLYAAALEYPPELLTEDALLEAELGIDSLKQTSLLARVIEEFGLPDKPGDLRVWELPSLGRVADLVITARQGALR